MAGRVYVHKGKNDLTLHCPPCRYLVNLFIYDYLLIGLYDLLQIILHLIARLMGDGLDPYRPFTRLKKFFFFFFFFFFKYSFVFYIIVIWLEHG